jgi:uncharacterized protein (DUF305 family)
MPATPPEPADPSPAADAEGDDDADVDASDVDAGLRWYQPPSALQAIAMVVALLFLGGVAGWALASGTLDDAPNEVDVGFLQDMITHHEQAIVLSLPALDGAEDPSTRQHAQDVLLFQAKEIGIMQFLLDELGEDPGSRPEAAMAWMDMGPVAVDQMPGIASEAEVGALQEATGRDVDRLFLELMIEHHLGGIHMAEDAVERAADDRVRELAATMERIQSAEVGELRFLQRELGFAITE